MSGVILEDGTFVPDVAQEEEAEVDSVCSRAAQQETEGETE